MRNRAAAMPPPRLFLIDSYGFIFRAFHARARSNAPPMRNSAGVSTEAVYIFHNMVRKLIQQYQPEYLAAVWESAGPTLREQEFQAYKANRTETPEDLLAQIPLIRRTLDALRIPVLEFPGYEADDVIGTLAHRFDLPVVIVSSDKDMLQLVNDRVRMLNPMKDYTLYDRDQVKQFMGVYPEQVIDLLALKGDAVDNIPGAPGIGDKGAQQLIERFGSLDAALARAAEVERKSYRESLQNHRDQIELSRRLATIAVDVPIEVPLESLAAQSPDLDSLRAIYRELEFFSLLEQVGGTGSTAQPEAAPAVEDYQTFLTIEDAEPWLASLPPGALVAIANHDGVAISAAPGSARSMPTEAAAAILADPHRPKAFHDWKSSALPTAGPIHDLLLSAFLLLADPGDVDLAALSERYLHRTLGPSLEARAATIFELASLLDAELDRRQLRHLYDELDFPFLAVLQRMEATGVLIDRAELGALSVQMDTELQKLTREIHHLAGREFNINSPQQLGKILFEELNLPAPVKAGKGKVISTAADVLESLADEYPIARQVLDYRAIAKLKGTYVDALPALIDSHTGRVHTTFNPAGAATGRLSSTNPNLQNIPIRTALGREIRAAFVARPGWRIVTADYSQIELRLLAHFSKDALLTDAFRRNEDIHTRTAAEVFGVPPLMVDSDMRRNAKAVNFGIVYGQTSFGLALQLGISRKEADEYIKTYFARYSGVRKYLDATIAEVRKSGVSKTLFGRERPIPDINSRNPNARGFAERTAVNTPLQGTAADLIKLAMIRIDRRLRAENWQSLMLLQVHDELVFESPESESAALAKMVKQEMESVRQLNVPLLVETGIGLNWRDAK